MVEPSMYVASSSTATASNVAAGTTTFSTPRTVHDTRDPSPIFLPHATPGRAGSWRRQNGGSIVIPRYSTKNTPFPDTEYFSHGSPVPSAHTRATETIRTASLHSTPVTTNVSV